MKILSNLKSILTIISSVGVMLAGSMAWVDTNFARDERVTRIEKKMDIHDLMDLKRSAQAEMYHYKKLSRQYPEDSDIADLLKIHIDQVNDLKEQIKAMK